jgi:hypothetical protein
MYELVLLLSLFGFAICMVMSLHVFGAQNILVSKDSSPSLCENSVNPLSVRLSVCTDRFGKARCQAELIVESVLVEEDDETRCSNRLHGDDDIYYVSDDETDADETIVP